MTNSYMARSQDGWWKIRYAVPSSGSVVVLDRTTWNVQAKSNPVHLVPTP